MKSALIVRCVLLAISIAIAGCALTAHPTGMWRLRAGQERAMFGSWLAIRRANSPSEVEVVWDNGLNCSSALGTIQGGRIHVRIWDVPAQIVLKGGSAEVMFETDRPTGVVVHLKRTKETPYFVCE